MNICQRVLRKSRAVNLLESCIQTQVLKHARQVLHEQHLSPQTTIKKWE